MQVNPQLQKAVSKLHQLWNPKDSPGVAEALQVLDTYLDTGTLKGQPLHDDPPAQDEGHDLCRYVLSEEVGVEREDNRENDMDPRVGVVHKDYFDGFDGGHVWLFGENSDSNHGWRLDIAPTGHTNDRVDQPYDVHITARDGQHGDEIRLCFNTDTTLGFASIWHAEGATGVGSQAEIDRCTHQQASPHCKESGDDIV